VLKESNDYMLNSCMLIHNKLNTLPIFKFPFPNDIIPKNGIYFFYEKGEYWGHGGSTKRIVHVGIHVNGKLKADILRHFIEENPKMHLTKSIYSALSNSKNAKNKSEYKKFANYIKHRFSFRFIIFDKNIESPGFEKILASTLSECLYCTPSRDWVGNNSPNILIRKSGLWKVPKEKLKMDKNEQQIFDKLVKETYNWLKIKGVIAPILKY